MCDLITPESLVFSPRLNEISSHIDDPRWITFSLTQFDSQQKSVTNIFLHNTQTYETRQLTRSQPGASASSPVLVSLLHPQGEVDHVFFLRTGKIWAVPLEGGESHIVWEESLPINSFQVAGLQGERFIIAEIAVSVQASDPFAPADALTNCGKGVLSNNLMVRYWTEWDPSKKRNHLFFAELRVDEEGCAKAEKPGTDLLHKIETDCPAKPPGGHGHADYALSPNGRWLAISCKRFEEETGRQPQDAAWTTDMPIYLADLCSINPTLQPVDPRYRPLKWKAISDSSLHTYHGHPVFSPDGNHLAFLSMRRPGYESDRQRIVVYNLHTNTLVTLTEDVDISFQSISWSREGTGAEGHTLYALGQHQASLRAFRLHFKEEGTKLDRMEVLKGDASRTSLQVVDSSILYFLESSLVSPSQLKRVDLDKSSAFEPFPLVHFFKPAEDAPLSMEEQQDQEVIWDPNPGYNNGDYLLPSVKQHYFPGAKGDLVHCWYLPPLLDEGDLESADASSVPLLVIIHGGPQAAMLNAWNYRWNLAAFASQGYAVMAVNFHGSTGFGSNFQDAIRKDWGGAPFEDIMKGLDFILAKYFYLNPNRVAALGASYGGYMINWLNGNTNRFRCLINHAGIYSLRSEYCTTEELFFPEWELGKPWEEPEVYARWSPDSFVKNWQTPTFVIHGGKDFRVPETEGLATFTTLQRRGIPSQLLYFADEGHWILQPHNSIQWYTEVLAWLKKWLRD
eukprot:scaffold1208_cov163-Ochromonas_danica.AAC.22